MNRQRLAKLRSLMTDQGLDGTALMPGPNMYYFSGIHSHISERPVILFLPTNDEPAIIIPTLEAMKAQEAGIPAERIFAWSDQEGYDRAFHEASAQLRLSQWTLGVEKYYMRVFEHDLLRQFAAGIHTAHAESLIYSLRSVKDEQEIAAMEKAVAVAERALSSLMPRIKKGMSEKQVAALLTQELVEAGAESMAFGPIVAAGPNSASPHATPTDRRLQEGDLMVIDWGVYVDDYPSDITRTFAVGGIDDELKQIYEIVKLANSAGKSAAKPGASGQDVDRAARKIIDDAGYGEQFFHRTGHGLGLEVHELPNMAEGSIEALKPGNVFTVEPGIYLTGRGGVRIEDDILITPAGSRSLTSFPRELISLG